MVKHIFFILFFLISLTLKVGATCEDKPGDSVDYSGCQFADGQDLSASYLTNSNLSLTSFNKVNFDRSMMMHSDLSHGNFAESSFFSFLQAVCFFLFFCQGNSFEDNIYSIFFYIDL